MRTFHKFNVIISRKDQPVRVKINGGLHHTIWTDDTITTAPKNNSSNDDIFINLILLSLQ